MRYKYKVRELTDDNKHINREQTKQILNNYQYSNIEAVSNVGEEKEMEAMSFKKLQRKLDPKKEYLVMYTNKKNNACNTYFIVYIPIRENNNNKKGIQWQIQININLYQLTKLTGNNWVYLQQKLIGPGQR